MIEYAADRTIMKGENDVRAILFTITKKTLNMDSSLIITKPLNVSYKVVEIPLIPLMNICTDIINSNIPISFSSAANPFSFSNL